MQYRGVNFTVVQSIERGRWKWEVDLPKPRRGDCSSRDEALIEVQKAIDRALAPKIFRLPKYGPS